MSGLTDKVTGKAKQVAGVMSDDKKLESEGKADEAKGKLKDKATDILEAAGDKVDELKKNIQNK